jgi:predicted enzyme related to lactoylglutathione lyase
LVFPSLWYGLPTADLSSEEELKVSERNGYEPGVPMWVDTWRADAEPASRFYAELLGWELAGLDDDGPQRYVIGQLRGRDVAAIGSPLPPAAPASPPAWTTYVWVASADEAAAAVTDAGGSLLTEPFDSMDGGRMAIAADPAGAAFAVWAPGAHRGAELVNEPGAWSMSVLQTPDPDSARSFYGAVFGWEGDWFGPVTMFRLPGFVGGEPEQPVPRDVVATMLPAGPEAGGKAAWTVDFWVSDVEAVAERAAALGGAVLVEPAPVPGTALVQAVIADPEGAALSMTELRIPS